jgi:pyruvate-ferredoxin/flavodoxin oxidoreductase
MRDGMAGSTRAVAGGYWPLMHYHPVPRTTGGNPFPLDSPRPRTPLTDYTDRELRFRGLHRSDPAEAARLAQPAREVVDQRWQAMRRWPPAGPERFPADARPNR